MVFWGRDTINNTRNGSSRESVGSRELEIEESPYRQHDRKRRLVDSERSSPVVVEKKSKSTSFIGRFSQWIFGNPEKSDSKRITAKNMNGNTSKASHNSLNSADNTLSTQFLDSDDDEEVVCTLIQPAQSSQFPEIMVVKDTTCSPERPVVTLYEHELITNTHFNRSHGKMVKKKINESVIELQDETDTNNKDNEITVLCVRSPTAKSNRLDVSAISRQIMNGDDNDLICESSTTNLLPATHSPLDHVEHGHTPLDDSFLITRSLPRLPYPVYTPTNPAPLVVEKKGSVPADLKARPRKFQRTSQHNVHKKPMNLGKLLENIDKVERENNENDETETLDRYRALVAKYGGIVVDRKEAALDTPKIGHHPLRNHKDGKSIFKRNRNRVDYLGRVRSALNNAGSADQSRATSPDDDYVELQSTSTSRGPSRALSPAYSVTSSIASSRVSEKHTAIFDQLQKKIVERKESEYRNATYAREHEQRTRRIALLEEEAKIKEADRKLKSRDHLEDLRRRLELTGISVPKPEPEEEKVDEFPELPGDALALVSSAWDKRRIPSEKFCEAFDIPITRKDLATLSGLNWLNDEIINFYMNLIVQRSKENGKLPKTYAYNTFFYANISGSKGYASVKRWTKKVDIFAHDVLLVPVHLHVHWCMAVIDMGQKCIDYYDSLFGRNEDAIFFLKDYLEKESMDKKKTPFSFEGWTFNLWEQGDIPGQKNGSDCGVFACRFAEYASRRANIVFSQDHMPYFRQRMVWEICQKKLMNS